MFPRPGNVYFEGVYSPPTFFMGWGLNLLKRSVMMERSWYTSVIQREDEAGWREEEEEKADSQQKTRTPPSDVEKYSKIMRAFCFGNSWSFAKTMDRLWSIHRGEKYSVRSWEALEPALTWLSHINGGSPKTKELSRDQRKVRQPLTSLPSWRKGSTKNL